jgi:hypothetical protein
LPPPIPSTSAHARMPRAVLHVRAARRAAIALSTFPNGGHFFSLSHTCPYCSKTLKSSLARDRHIILKPYCRARHLHALRNPIPKRRKHKRKRANTNPLVEGEPPPKQARTQENPPPVPGTDAEGPAINDGGDKDERQAPDERILCGQPFVESFPISTAGAPICEDVKEPPNLREYVKSCGMLSNPELFDTAELLVMTVPKSKDRTRHLQSQRVSQSYYSFTRLCAYLPSNYSSTRGRHRGRTIAH